MEGGKERDGGMDGGMEGGMEEEGGTPPRPRLSALLGRAGSAAGRGPPIRSGGPARAALGHARAAHGAIRKDDAHKVCEGGGKRARTPGAAGPACGAPPSTPRRGMSWLGRLP